MNTEMSSTLDVEDTAERSQMNEGKKKKSMVKVGRVGLLCGIRHGTGVGGKGQSIRKMGAGLSNTLITQEIFLCQSKQFAQSQF